MQHEQQTVITNAVKQLIILATNIAETSMTLPDVQVVIDSGLHKQMTVNELTNQNELVTDYISIQNAVQRRGRTGRNCDGIYA